MLLDLLGTTSSGRKLDRTVPATQMVALYDCALSFVEAYRLGLDLFNAAGITPNNYACALRTATDDPAIVVKEFKSSARLVPYLERADIHYIVIAKEDSDDERVNDIVFYFGRHRYSRDFYQLVLSCPIAAGPVFVGETLLDFVRQVDSVTPVRYGLGCALPRHIHPYKYSDSQTVFVSSLEYEDASLWKVEVPSYLSEAPSLQRYLTGHLRLVYPINFINTRHLAMPIAGGTLQDWITQGRSRGILKVLGDDLWVWEVDEAMLTQINRDCAQAGLLVAWKEPIKARVGLPLP